MPFAKKVTNFAIVKLKHLRDMITKYNIPSEIGAKSYWDNEGQLQSEYDKLYNELVPASGEGKNLFAEVVRAVSRLGYEYLNNGNCNARDTEEIEGDWVECSYCCGSGTCEDEDGEEYECPECGGDGGYYEESEYEYSISEFYGRFIKLLREFFQQYAVAEIGDKCLNRIESIILTDDNMRDYFSKENRQAYDAIIDLTLAVIIGEGTESSPELPEWYKDFTE